MSDTGAIEKFCDEAIAANPNSVADYKNGKVAALNFLKGQVMKLSKGKANPNLVGEILEKKLKGSDKCLEFWFTWLLTNTLMLSKLTMGGRKYAMMSAPF